MAVLQRESEQDHRLAAGPTLGRAVILPLDVQNLDRIISGLFGIPKKLGRLINDIFNQYL